MIRFVSGAFAALVIAGAAGCQEEPSFLCDRVRVVWPFFQLEPSLDTSSAEGLQIDLPLRTSLLPGTEARLTVQGPDVDPVSHPASAIADASGDLLFRDVTVPFGRVRLQVNAENECGEVRSARTPYVWDGLGFPRCELDLGFDPPQVTEPAPLGLVCAEHDLDPTAPGAQLRVTVRAGRPDMKIDLFAVDVASGAQQVFEEESGADVAAEFDMTLAEGEQALRAACVWETGDLRPSSPTLRLWVDTEMEDCSSAP